MLTNLALASQIQPPRSPKSRQKLRIWPVRPVPAGNRFEITLCRPGLGQRASRRVPSLRLGSEGLAAWRLGSGVALRRCAPARLIGGAVRSGSVGRRARIATKTTVAIRPLAHPAGGWNRHFGRPEEHPFHRPGPAVSGGACSAAGAIRELVVPVTARNSGTGRRSGSSARAAEVAQHRPE